MLKPQNSKRPATWMAWVKWGVAGVSLWAAGSSGCEMIDRQPEDMTSEARVGIRLAAPEVKPTQQVKATQELGSIQQVKADQGLGPTQQARLTSTDEPPTRYVLQTSAKVSTDGAVPTSDSGQWIVPTHGSGPTVSVISKVAPPPKSVDVRPAKPSILPKASASGSPDPSAKPSKLPTASPSGRSDGITIPPLIPPAGKEQPIDLTTALHIAGADNPNIAIA